MVQRARRIPRRSEVIFDLSPRHKIDREYSRIILPHTVGKEKHVETKDDQTHTVTENETSSASPAPAANKTHKGSKKKASVKTKSAKGAKKSAKKAKKATSPQAQTAEAIKDLSFDKLNKDEQKIVKAVYTPKGDRKPFTIKELMAATKLKTSPVRNGLRRPVRGRWLEPVDRGTYRLTEAGRKRGIPKNA